MVTGPSIDTSALPLGVARIADGSVIAANTRMEAIVRADAGGLTGRPLATLLDPDDAARVLARLAGEVDPEAPTWLPVAGRSPTGGPWIANLAVGDHRPGTTDGVLLLTPASPPLTVGDATDASGDPPTVPGAWDELHLDRVLSHDVRGGLRGVTSFLTLLDRQVGESIVDQAREFFDTAAAAAGRTDTMVERIVAVLRVLDRPVDLQPVRLATVVDDAATLSGHRFAGDAPVLQVGDLPTVWAEPSLLADALAELVTNARKFAGGPCTIDVAAATSDGWVDLTVRDDGPGVDPAFAEDAFLPFRLLQPKGRFPGVGMGLPLCRAIARAHGGRCSIDPDSSPGTTVRLRLLAA